MNLYVMRIDSSTLRALRMMNSWFPTNSGMSGSRFGSRIIQLRRTLAEQPPAWITGIACIIGAVFLFLTVALSLGVILGGLREKFDMAQRSQSVLLQALRIEDDIDQASTAIRAYHISHQHDDLKLAVTESHNATQKANSFLTLLHGNPAASREMRAVMPLIERRLRTLDQLLAATDGARETRPDIQATLLRAVSTDMATLRSRAEAAEGRRLHDADSNMLFAMGLALFAALAAPSLGVWGIYLLRRERSREHGRQLQMELMHAQRLAVMGETAAMLAHEVSHPLTAANNYMAALRRGATTTEAIDPEKVISLSERAAQQIMRASEILHRLRRFIEKRETERIVASPSALVEEAIALLGPIDGDVQINDETDPATPDIYIDRVQMQQVLVNLMRNAIQAMRVCPVRSLTISAAAPEPGFVQFSLADTGPGLPEDMANKLFQPFHSTKKDGLGIGLSICRAIVEDHHGAIWAEPNPGGGTIFHFRLPAARGIERHRALR